MTEPNPLDISDLPPTTLSGVGNIVALPPPERLLDTEYRVRYARLIMQLDPQRQRAFVFLMNVFPDWSIKERCELLGQVHEAMYREPPAGVVPEDRNRWFRVESGA